MEEVEAKDDDDDDATPTTDADRSGTDVNATALVANNNDRANPLIIIALASNSTQQGDQCSLTTREEGQTTASE